MRSPENCKQATKNANREGKGREGQSKYTHAIWLRIRGVGPALSLSLQLFGLNISCALDLRYLRKRIDSFAYCLWKQKQKLSQPQVTGEHGRGGTKGALLKYWQNVLIKQKTDKYWHLCAVSTGVRREVAKNLHRKMRFWVSVWQAPTGGRDVAGSGYLLGRQILMQFCRRPNCNLHIELAHCAARRHSVTSAV